MIDRTWSDSRRLAVIVGVALLALLAGCARDQVAQAPVDPAALASGAARPVADLLTQEEAVRRRNQVEEVSYGLEIDLTSTSEFTGRVEIELTRLNDNHPLTFDFSGGEIDRMTVNGRRVEVDYNGFFVTLSRGVLAPGENVVEIEFTHPYSSDGTGLYRMVDPLDGRSYLYTFLWPAYANRLFPCFDQPDLKATYQLDVIAPAEWTVVSTTRETTIEERAGGRNPAKLWRFPPSPRLSTYLYSLHAGPFRV